jgi:serine/threonine-protein kinase
VTALINEGQIFRFMPKPVEAGYLKLVINSALAKHRRLVATPGLKDRHAVVPTAASEFDALMTDVQAAARQVAKQETATASTSEGLLGRVSVGFRRLLGR